MYLHGKGVKKDYKKAYSNALEGAEKAVASTEFPATLMQAQLKLAVATGAYTLERDNLEAKQRRAFEHRRRRTATCAEVRPTAPERPPRP